jgi:hypothetical protein
MQIIRDDDDDDGRGGGDSDKKTNKKRRMQIIRDDDDDADDSNDDGSFDRIAAALNERGRGRRGRGRGRGGRGRGSGGRVRGGAVDAATDAATEEAGEETEAAATRGRGHGGGRRPNYFLDDAKEGNVSRSRRNPYEILGEEIELEKDENPKVETIFSILIRIARLCNSNRHPQGYRNNRVRQLLNTLVQIEVIQRRGHAEMIREIITEIRLDEDWNDPRAILRVIRAIQKDGYIDFDRPVVPEKENEKDKKEKVDEYDLEAEDINNDITPWLAKKKRRREIKKEEDALRIPQDIKREDDDDADEDDDTRSVRNDRFLQRPVRRRIEPQETGLD